jgi:hypothetical protein
VKKLADGGGLIAPRLIAAFEFEIHEGLLLPLQQAMRKLAL